MDDDRRTPTIEKTLNPVWPDEDVPVLQSFVSNREFLETQHLFMIVRDYDHATKDDEMGQAVISLRGACAGGEPMEFTVPVIDQGKPYGYLHGRVSVVWGKSSRPTTAKAAQLRAGLQTLDDAAVLEVLAACTREDPRLALATMAAGSPQLAALLEQQLTTRGVLQPHAVLVKSKTDYPVTSQPASSPVVAADKKKSSASTLERKASSPAATSSPGGKKDKKEKKDK